MNRSEKRIDNLLNIKIKYFYHPDFDEKSKIDSILCDIPEKEKFDKERKKVESLRHSNKSLELRPCYEEPLLTREQEYHLFKKMNYYKYRTKKLIDKLNSKKPCKNLIDQIELFIEKALEIRNQIANSNFRLASYILTKDFKKYRSSSSESSLSDAFLDVIKSIDYFNFTLGNKFSTYCVWVLRRNFFRGINDRRLKGNEFASLDENFEELMPSHEDFDFDINRRENATFINSIIKVVKKRLRSKDIKRQVKIVEEYYGINGKQRKNLEEISSCLGITKERVRQLKEKFLLHMREIIKDAGKEYVI